MHKLVLLRHGESIWNKENLFTGWTDVDLSEKGIEEAKDAGRKLKAEGFIFDLAYTSVLKRAIRTLWLALDEMEQMWLPVKKNWRLNEKHYGALQGMNKKDMAVKYGDAQVQLWRRSYDTRPPALDANNPSNSAKQLCCRNIPKNLIPDTECLKDTVDRFLPLWHEEIAPDIKSGKNILISAHGNSLRALIKYLDNVSDSDILNLNVPTGIPLIYELDDNLKPIKNYYLGNEEEIQKAINSVANQGKK